MIDEFCKSPKAFEKAVVCLCVAGIIIVIAWAWLEKNL